MFKYLILFLISLTCVASEPKFHYMDCVKITKGFYKGCNGNVVSYEPAYHEYEAIYNVDVEDCKNQSFYKDFNESELKRCSK